MGHSEKVIGRAIQGLDRGTLQIATKTGLDLRFNDPEDHSKGFSMNASGDPAFIRKTCLECLERLDTPTSIYSTCTGST